MTSCRDFFYSCGFNETINSHLLTAPLSLLDTVTLSTEANYAYTYIKYAITDWQVLETTSFFWKPF